MLLTVALTTGIRGVLEERVPASQVEESLGSFPGKVKDVAGWDVLHLLLEYSLLNDGVATPRV